ncbi:hypothetical protein AB835_08215 [Candidatus Endobugula sertula]|uniref:Uncharacterized protein n=1 Tax=Candidatus Endobugula sertula TaxID=62101 RepID=A0A1D2QPT4_9GAMM|nr:hypothetical protein AB835_08215 [Candidatus Endobugula sertula]
MNHSDNTSMLYLLDIQLEVDYANDEAAPMFDVKRELQGSYPKKASDPDMPYPGSVLCVDQNRHVILAYADMSSSWSTIVAEIITAEDLGRFAAMNALNGDTLDPAMRAFVHSIQPGKAYADRLLDAMDGWLKGWIEHRSKRSVS